MLLEITDLTKEYRRNGSGHRSVPFAAVKEVSLSLDAGDFVSIVGRSGSGKTTLLNMAAGLLSPSAGAISIDGRSILSLSDRELSLLRNSRIGFVPQGQSLLANLSVFENVTLPAFLFDSNADEAEAIGKRALELLGQVGIAPLAASYPRQLSGGELRRVSIARALINKPAILIADEPTGDLDAETTAGIMELFSRIAREGTAVLMVTHELDTLRYGDRVYRMDGGSLSIEPTNIEG
jgi:putative ABC transport system ATP-binding protein